MPTDKFPRPPLDVEFKDSFLLSEFADVTLKDPDDVAQFRDACSGWFRMARESIHADPDMAIEEQVIPGPHGDIPIVIVRRKTEGTKGNSNNKPALLWLHGGARVTGDAYTTLANATPVAKEFDAVVVSVDYRLAPEYSGMVSVEDCYTALSWLFASAGTLGVDDRRIMLGGESAGGGLAACTAILARDKKGIHPFALLLQCPMLDDRQTTLSSQQFKTGQVDSDVIGVAWLCVLGDQYKQPGVSPYIVAGRLEDFSGLPPAYIDIGDAEAFRDEGVAFATKLWEHGVPAELHVWAGGIHGFDGSLPAADISKRAKQTRMNWIRRQFFGI